MTEKSAPMNGGHLPRFMGVPRGPVDLVSNPRGHAAPSGKGKTDG